jgi:hypothetical protein
MAEYPERDCVLILQHQSDAGPGNLASWLHGRGLAFEVLDVPSGPLPPASARRALVILGSRESVYDDSVPWLAAEASFVRAMLAAGTPVLGLCFGAQLPASVLGGAVSKAPRAERGWIGVAATRTAAARPILGQRRAGGGSPGTRTTSSRRRGRAAVGGVLLRPAAIATRGVRNGHSATRCSRSVDTTDHAPRGI